MERTTETVAMTSCFVMDHTVLIRTHGQGAMGIRRGIQMTSQTHGGRFNCN